MMNRHAKYLPAHSIVIALSLGVLVGGAAVTTGCATMYTQPAYSEPVYEPEVERAPDPTGGVFVELSAYGRWVDVHPHGWVWRPSVVVGWEPYYHGHWVWSSWGWTWVSYEPFGWAVYHYGSWVYDPVWGWVWSPDYTWYPARVEWRVYDDYICWAPLPPRGYSIGDPWSSRTTFIWNVVYVKNFTRNDIGRFKVKPRRMKAPTSIKVEMIRKAPDVKYVERGTGAPVHPVEIQVKKVKVGDKTYQKMALPPSQRERVDRYQPRVERHVLKPVVKKEIREERKTIRQEKGRDEKAKAPESSEKDKGKPAPKKSPKKKPDKPE